MAARSARRSPLRIHEDGIERLARRHEEPVALGTAEADVAAHLGQADAPEQLAFRRPDGHAVIADGPSCIAGNPEIAVDIGPDAVGAALYPIDHEIAEQLAIRDL